MGQQRTLEERQGFAVHVPRPRGRELVDQWGNRTGDETRQPGQRPARAISAVMFFHYDVIPPLGTRISRSATPTLPIGAKLSLPLIAFRFELSTGNCTPALRAKLPN